MVKSLMLALVLLPQTACAITSTIADIEATSETDPIPFGTKDTDDAAVWYNAVHPGQSLILGTSKVTPRQDRTGGVGVYDLGGHQLQFIPGDKLNNIDMAFGLQSQDRPELSWGVASNRTAKGIDLYTVNRAGEVTKENIVPLRDAAGTPLAPYGLCVASRKNRLEVFLPTKSGQIYRFHVILASPQSANLLGSIDLSTRVAPADDDFIKMIVEKTARAENELEDLPEKLLERFALEGCAYDIVHDRLYVGMENFGIWSLDLSQEKDPTIEIFQKISGSWTDIAQWSQDDRLPRITDDIEGMDIFSWDQHSYLIVSNQGISEFSLFDLEQKKLVGNFKVHLTNDPVTATDGVTVLAKPLSPALPGGVVVVHDDANTNSFGQRENANYKIVSLAKIMAAFNLVSSSPKAINTPSPITAPLY